MPSPAVASGATPSSRNAVVALPPMLLKSTLTARPVLVGFVPAVVDTVSTVEADGATLLGDAAPLPVGDVGVNTVNAIVAELLRPCASVIVAGRLLAPG